MYAIRFLDDLEVGSMAARFEAQRGAATARFIRTKSIEAYNALYDIACEVHDPMQRPLMARAVPVSRPNTTPPRRGPMQSVAGSALVSPNWPTDARQSVQAAPL